MNFKTCRKTCDCPEIERISMPWSKDLSRIWVLVLCFPLILTSQVEAHNATSIISRNHVSVWFDYSVRYYDHEADNAYTKEDIAVMVNLVSTRFGKVVIGGAPVVDKLPLDEKNIPHSRILVPIVVAEHNQKNVSTSMKVIVSFDVARLARTAEVTSFDVAKYMADKANDIHLGTVDTIMMDLGFSFFVNIQDIVQQFKVAREKIDSKKSKYGYELALFLSLKDCGRYRGTKLGEKAQESLPYVDTMVVLLSPNVHHLSFGIDSLHKMFIAKFEDCERRLHEEKPKLKGWQLMSDWAEKNEREVIMLEAFDTPHGHLLADRGWWRLKDKAEHKISEDGFIEKIEEMSDNSKPDSGNPSSTEENSDEDNIDSLAERSKRKRLRSEGPVFQAVIPEAVYIVLTLLAVIVTLLVAVIAGLVYGFHIIVLRQNNGGATFHHVNGTLSTRNVTNANNGAAENNIHSRSRHSSNNDDDGASLNGPFLEIRDSTPIVAVTYKK